MTMTMNEEKALSETLAGKWEERWHPLREEWVIVAAHRQNRPWSGEMLESVGGKAPEYIQACYLCPRNERVGGVHNDDYKSVFVFDNDLPSVGQNAPTELEKPVGIYQNRPANGLSRVICYSPNHSLSLAEMEQG